MQTFNQQSDCSIEANNIQMQVTEQKMTLYLSYNSKVSVTKLYVLFQRSPKELRKSVSARFQMIELDTCVQNVAQIKNISNNKNSGILFSLLHQNLSQYYIKQ